MLIPKRAWNSSEECKNYSELLAIDIWMECAMTRLKKTNIYFIFSRTNNMSRYLSVRSRHPSTGCIWYFALCTTIYSAKYSICHFFANACACRAHRNNNIFRISRWCEHSAHSVSWFARTSIHTIHRFRSNCRNSGAGTHAANDTQLFYAMRCILIRSMFVECFTCVVHFHRQVHK